MNLILTFLFLRHSAESTLTNVGIAAIFWKPLNNDLIFWTLQLWRHVGSNGFVRFMFIHDC